VVTCGRVDERRGDQAIRRECRPIVAEGSLILGAALHVLEDEVRQAATRDFAEMVDVERARKALVPKRTTSPGHWKPIPPSWKDARLAEPAVSARFENPRPTRAPHTLSRLRASRWAPPRCRSPSRRA